ncbi:MAG: CpaD family pilus assembly protein [Sphingosinicella sp.]
MDRHTRIAAIIGLALATAACGPATNQLSAFNNPSLYSVHQPVVERTDFVLDLAVSGDSLAPAEAGRLRDWLGSIGVGYGDRLAIDEPEGFRHASARSVIVDVAADFGLGIAGAPITNGEVPPGSIRVIASRTVASVPGCPEWGNAAEDAIDPNALTSSNFGCATNSNLAAMIANPEDLVLGQEGTSQGSATTATRAVRTYRERQPTGRQGLPATSTTGN